MTTALILIDLQQDYFPDGRMECEGATAAVQKAHLLLERFRHRGLPICHIQHISTRPGATFFLPDTPGIAIHPLVSPVPGEELLIKHHPNSFLRTSLGDWLKLRSIAQLVIAGMMTHMCIDATVRAAKDHGYACTVAADACATRELSFQKTRIPAPMVHAAFLAGLQGVYAQVTSSEDVFPTSP